MADEEQDDEVRAFSTSGDSPLDGKPQPVAPIANPVPGDAFDDDEGAGQSPE